MSFELVNKSELSDKKIYKLIEFCKPKNCKVPKIIFKNCNDENKIFYGEFYFYFHPLENDPFIIFRFNFNAKYPCSFEVSKKHSEKYGYVEGIRNLSSKNEALVLFCSHELHHSTLYNQKSTWFKNNLKKREELADKFSFRKLNEYRKLILAGQNPLK